MGSPRSIFFSACLFLLIFGGTSTAATWRTYDGQTIKASVSSFDYENKMVTLENMDTQARAAYKTLDLDYKSARMLLVSPKFFQSYPKGRIWSKEQMTLVGIYLGSPIILLIVGMWLAGLFIAKRFNPFSAIGAFIGSWIAGAILLICYMIFASKSSGNGTMFIVLGALIATLVMSLYISAIYKTTFFRGFFIFIGHLFFAALIGFLLIYGTDTLLAEGDVSQFWNQWIFRPVGLTDSPSPGGY